MESTDFSKFIKDARAWYKKIKYVYCPLLQENVIFNSKGFYHLRYNSHGRERTRKEQIYKLRLLKFSIQVITQAKNIHRYESMYSKKLDKNVTQWGISTRVGKNGQTIRVVLRKIGNGQITFFSIM